nr:uncharacterized protein LOC111414678 [Onthophagus taurus]
MALQIALSCLCLILFSNGITMQNVNQPNQPSSQVPNLGEFESDSSIDEPIVFKTKEECAGCPTKINTNAEGVDPLLEMAMKDIESVRDRRQLLLELIDLERQVVNGIKFGATIKVGSSKCLRNADIILSSCELDESIDSEYCRIEFLQKPWISNDKFIIRNNCTSKTYSFPEEAIIKTTTTQKPKELTPEDIRNIEMQIISDDLFNYMFENEDFENRLDTPVYSDAPLQILDLGSMDDEDNRFYDVRRKRGLHTSEESNSNETSSEEHHKRTVRELNTSEDSKSNDTSVSSHEHQRVRRSDSSSSSSSSDDDNNGNNGNGEDNNVRQSYVKGKESHNDKNGNGDDNNDTSSSSSSDDDNNDNNGKKNKIKRGTPLEALDEKILLRNLANFVTSSLDDTDDDDFKQIPASIVKLQRSDIEGLVYHLKLKIVDSICPETKTTTTDNFLVNHSHNEECHSDLIPNTTKVCKVKVYVPNTFVNPKILSSRCHYVEQGGKRYKRAGIPGGVSPTSVDNPEIISLAESTLKLLDGESGHSNKYKVVKIHSATTQVVAGSLTKISADIAISDCLKSDSKDAKLCGIQSGSTPKTCKIEVWDRPWLPDGKQTTVTCDAKVSKFRSKRDLHASPHGTMRRKRQIVGAPIEASADDPEIIKMTQTAVKQFDTVSSDSTKYKIVKIHTVTKQVVAGVLYKIKAEIVLTDCPKTDPTDANICGTAKEANSRLCEIEIWSRPWIQPGGTETTVKCGDQQTKVRSKRSLRYNQDRLDNIAFNEFLNKYDISYDSEIERSRRFKIFQTNLKVIELQNLSERGSAVYGITRFADLTPKEFKRNYLGLKINNRVENEIPFAQAEIPDIDLPTEFSWKDKNAVTPVKDQGSCGSCWAFSTTGNVEGQYAIKYGNLLEFSEQELVDCDSYDEGCGGGLMDNAYRAIENLGGLELESDYPYDGKNEKCHFNKTLSKVQLSGALNISQNEDDMAKWLTQNGPIAIAINANAMQFYVGGVSHPWKLLCNPKNLDHGVLIVGYGVHSYPNLKKDLPYWEIKNSWGKRWGEQGYYKVYRGDGTCGVNQTPSSAIVA